LGLTHYWRCSPILPSAAFARAVEDCRRIMPRLGVALGWGSHGSEPAVFTDQAIMFNGVGPEYRECFVVHQLDRRQMNHLQAFSFTKTDGLPYDLCVRVALIILQHHMGKTFFVYSDDQNWEDAMARCQEHLGYGREFRLSE
jgi:hypothetical protein